MGLDISAYSYIKIHSVSDEYGENLDWDTTDQFYINPSFPHAVAGTMWDGQYVAVSGYDESMDFRAGSYSGYNHWRRQLAELAGTTVDLVWEEPDAFTNLPFYEIINFSDAEGVFGPEVSLKLYMDFVRFRDQAVALSAEEPFNRFISVYDDFTEGFRMAAKSGILVFH